jgi:hypothetical protein
MTTHQHHDGPIDTIESLREHLQIAIEIEHATLPPYLCALYSIKEGRNQEAAAVIKSVLMEEMLHMTLAANVLNAIGGTPRIDSPDFVPSYPTGLPHSDDAFQVSLLKFSPAAIETFKRIERPAKADAPPQPHDFATIGQFYEAIENGLKRVCADDKHFIKDHSRQVTPNHYYYGGGGKAVVVTDLASALKALEEIVNQGEGIDHTIFDGDQKIFGLDQEYAHYFRFNEIHLGRYYADDDTPKSGPSGPMLPVDWTAVYDMQPNPKMADYPPGSEIRDKMEMYELKYKALALMRIPSGSKGQTVGPSFEYLV